MKYPLLLSLAAFFFISSCGLFGPDGSSESLMPLAIGNKWVYQKNYYSQDDPQLTGFHTDSILVLNTVDITIQNRTFAAFSMQGFYKLPPLHRSAHWLLADEPEGLYLIGGLVDDAVFEHKTLLIKYPYYTGSSWSDSAVFYHWGFYGPLFFSMETFETECISIDAKVSTSAGDFNCVVFHFRRQTVIDVSQKMDFYDYYAVGVGLVRREIKDDGFLIMQKNLTSYEVQ